MRAQAHLQSYTLASHRARDMATSRLVIGGDEVASGGRSANPSLTLPEGSDPEALFRAYGPWLLRTLQQKFGKEVADDLLQETYLRVARHATTTTAEAVRAYLLIRLGLHLGLRQKNLRQLLVCPRGERPRSERALEDLKCGELRWSERDQGWEVLVPAVAFKNAHSSFFGKKPYRLVLPDLEGLYDLIDAWIERHRPILLGQARDPQTFFVKTVKSTSADAAYNQTTFYEAWRLTIQRYGIYNPYTGRGAIEGLLPHGPHNVRDVLATHILKKTGSYEQASYAIQDTPETVAAHYGRFLPQDKAALAAQILNEVWLAA